MYYIWREQYTKSAVHIVIEEFNVSLEEIVNLHLPIIEAIEENSTDKWKAIKHHYKTIIENM